MMTIEGLDIVVSGGKAKLTPNSWNKSNPSGYRVGTAQYKVAVMNKAKADRILKSLNSTGSYTNSHGMRTYMNGEQKAVYGSEAWKMQQMINARGGLKPQPIRDQIEEMEEEMEEEEEKRQEIAYAVEEIQMEMERKIQAYFDKVNEASSNIGQSIVDVLTY